MKDETKKEEKVVGTKYTITIKQSQRIEKTTTYGVSKDTNDVIEYDERESEIYSQTKDGELDLKAIIDEFNK